MHCVAPMIVKRVWLNHSRDASNGMLAAENRGPPFSKREVGSVIYGFS